MLVTNCDNLFNFIVGTVGQNPITLAFKRTLHLWHCVLQLKTAYLLQKRVVILPITHHHGNSLIWTCLWNEMIIYSAGFCFHGREESCMRNQNPLYEGKSVHVSPFPQRRCIAPNNSVHTVCFVKNQNNFPLYGGILSLSSYLLVILVDNMLFIMNFCGI